MAYSDTVTLAHDNGFRDRLLAAITTTAVGIIRAKPTGDTRDDQRRQQALLTLSSPQTQLERFCWAVASIPAIATAGTNVTDNQLGNAVTTLWDALSGLPDT